MADVRRLIDRLAAEEAASLAEPFVAPCTRRGRLRVRVAGMVRTFAPRPADLEGWGVFRAVDERVAERVRDPEPYEVAAYLDALPALRVWLSRPLAGQSWLAVAANDSDAVQRFACRAPVTVRLVSSGGRFDRIVARGDGVSWWFDEEDRRADPETSATLRGAMDDVPASELRVKGLTPELARAYRLATEPEPPPGTVSTTRAGRRGREVGEGERLRDALRMAGGELTEYRDQGGFWWVEWRTRDGCRHESAIAKDDLTVITAGICLDGLDRDFDLQSLVGVMEGADDIW